MNIDFGSFRCISKNSIGQAEEYIEVYGKLRQAVPKYMLKIVQFLT